MNGHPFLHSLQPNYYDQGVSAYWLDETDGEGTRVGDGEYGYNTSYGPAVAYSNLWVNSWLQTFSEPVAALGDVPPLVLVRGIWAGGQRYGAVLWSSDIESSFEELTAQVSGVCVGARMWLGGAETRGLVSMHHFMTPYSRGWCSFA